MAHLIWIRPYCCRSYDNYSLARTIALMFDRSQQTHHHHHHKTLQFPSEPEGARCALCRVRRVKHPALLHCLSKAKR